MMTINIAIMEGRVPLAGIHVYYLSLTLLLSTIITWTKTMAKKTADRRGERSGQPMDKKSGRVCKRIIKRPTAAAGMKKSTVSEADEHLIDLDLKQVTDPRPNLTCFQSVDTLQQCTRNVCNTRLPVIINDCLCLLDIDSGSSCNYLTYATAKDLLLLENSYTRSRGLVTTWGKRTLVNWIILENVPVYLENGIMFTFFVDENNAAGIDCDMISGETLARLNAVQTFSTKGSNIYFKPTDRSCKFQGEGPLLFLKGQIKRFPSEPFSIVIDSGADGEMYLSKEWMDRLQMSTQTRRVKRLFQTDQKTYMTGHIHKNTVAGKDMIMGARFLSKYNCILDYREKHLYFNIGNKTYLCNLV